MEWFNEILIGLLLFGGSLCIIGPLKTAGVCMIYVAITMMGVFG